MQDWAEGGMLELRFPIEGQEERLAAILKNYKNWAKLHNDPQGLRHAFIRTLHETIPFFNETSVSHIKADIKGDKPQPQHLAEEDPVFNARLFLAFAQEFDMENDRLRHEFTSIAEMENDLFTSLHGLNGDQRRLAGKSADTFADAGDIFDYMIEKRFKAWHQLLQFDDKLTDSPGFFITTSRAALTHLLDAAPCAQKIASLNSIPVPKFQSGVNDAWRRQLADQLQQLTKKAGSMQAVDVSAPPADETCKAAVSLHLYLAPAEALPGIFSRCAGQQTPPAEKTDRGGRAENTFIAYLSVDQPI
jgi:hypothetical protein